MGLHPIVISGGPCAGKTTGLPLVQAHLEALGIRVATVCESSTLMWGCGVPFPVGSTGQHMFTWEVEKTRVQLNIEDSLRRVLAHEAKTKCVVLLHDRGAMDAHAYLPEDTVESGWAAITDALSTDTAKICARYAGVVHLTSLAVDCSKKYSGAVGSRREDVAMAREVDRRLSQAWAPHPCRVTVRSSYDGDLARKAAVATWTITAMLGFAVVPRLSVGSFGAATLYFSLPTTTTASSSSSSAFEYRFRSWLMQDTSTAVSYALLTLYDGAATADAPATDEPPSAYVLSAHTSDRDVQQEVVSSADEARQLLSDARVPASPCFVRRQTREWVSGKGDDDEPYIIDETVYLMDNKTVVARGCYVVSSHTVACKAAFTKWWSTLSHENEEEAKIDFSKVFAATEGSPVGPKWFDLYMRYLKK
eukprot:PhM_4_TR12693/c0_g1_i1/m.55288